MGCIKEFKANLKKIPLVKDERARASLRKQLHAMDFCLNS